MQGPAALHLLLTQTAQVPSLPCICRAGQLSQLTYCSYSLVNIIHGGKAL